MNPVQQEILNALEWFLLTLFSVPVALAAVALLGYFIWRCSKWGAKNGNNNWE